MFTNHFSFAPEFGFDLEAAWNLEEICCVYTRQLADTFFKAKLGPKVVFIWTVYEPISLDDHPPGRFGSLYFMQRQHSDLQQVTRLFNDDAHPGARYLSLCRQVKRYELTRMSFLRHLRMFGCDVPKRVSLEALRVLELHGTSAQALFVRRCRTWPALQELHVSNDDSFSDDTVLGLECPHLVELSVKRCVQFQLQACHKVLRAHHRLSSLRIRCHLANVGVLDLQDYPQLRLLELELDHVCVNVKVPRLCVKRVQMTPDQE